jgi:hypothetical protein
MSKISSECVLPKKARPMLRETVAECKATLLLLREEFAAKSVRSDPVADFWRVLSVDRRRTLAALAGADDAVEFCARRWELLSTDNQRVIAACARDWARVLAPMRWAAV